MAQNEQPSSAPTAAPLIVPTVTQSVAAPKPGKLPPFNVVLLDDDDHSYEYVIVMLRKVFGYSETRGYEMAKEVDTQKRVIVFTSHKELAELKREMMIACGKDVRMDRSAGPMSVILEPAMG